MKCEPDSVVGVATGYGLDGAGIDSRWGRDFPHLSRPALGPTQPLVRWVPGLSRGVKSGLGVMLIPHPLLVSWSSKSRAIPLLLLWAARPVQSLSACTRVHFNFFTLSACTRHFVISRTLLLNRRSDGDSSVLMFSLAYSFRASLSPNIRLMRVQNARQCISYTSIP